MLKVRVSNSKDCLVSSSMEDSKGLKCISSLALELMVMVEFRAFDNNQCSIDWFKTQVKTIRLEQSTLV
jgi:hypothetical protein